MPDAGRGNPEHRADSSEAYRRVIALLLRRGWIAIIAVVAAVVAAWYWLDSEPRLYRATVSVVVQPEGPQVLSGIQPVVQGAPNRSQVAALVETRRRFIESRTVAEEVAARLNLGNDLVFLGLNDVRDQSALESALRSADPARVLRGAVSVVTKPDSAVVNVVATTRDPELSARIANTVAEVAVDLNLRQQAETADNAIEWLRKQYATLRKQMTDSEEALYTFRREKRLVTVSVEDRASLTGQLLSTLNGQLSAASLEVDRLRQQVGQLRLLRDRNTLLDAISAGLVDSELVESLRNARVALEKRRLELSVQFGEKHPDIVAIERQMELVDDSLAREVESVLMVYQERLRVSENVRSTLAARLEVEQEQAILLGQNELEYNLLSRDASSNREMFGVVERRLSELELTRLLLHNDLRMLERALPERSPVSPRPLQIVGIAVLLGLFLAGALILVLELTDTAVKTQETLEQQLGVPFLGMIPRMSSRWFSRKRRFQPAPGERFNPDTFVHDFPKSSAAEACRSIRTNLVFLSSEKPLNRLLVSSAGPREGKTTTAVSLCIVMAQSGRRVLIVDADMRKPRLHRALGLGASVGLASILVGESTIEAAVQTTNVPNLFVLPCGPVPTNPTELMETPRFRQVIDDLSSRYDLVVFDSPPIIPVTDAVALSAFVDGVVLVVRAGVTRKELVRRSVEMLDAVEANLLGVVLNDVDLEKREYGYYYYYYRRYGDYYGEDTPAARPATAPGGVGDADG